MKKMEKTKKEKLDILYEYIFMIKKSWTYEKLTIEEKETFDHIFYGEQIKGILKGTKKQIWQVLNMIYSSFLYGAGYNGFNWREKERIIKSWD